MRVDTPLGEDVLLLESFSGVERVSGCVDICLGMLSAAREVDAGTPLGSQAVVTLTFSEGSARLFHGLVRSVAETGRWNDLVMPDAELAPWLWFLSLTTDCRIFQNRSVPEVVEEVFHAEG